MTQHPTQQPPIYWISFDLDHTLWDSDPAIAVANQQLFEQLAALNPSVDKPTVDQPPTADAVNATAHLWQQAVQRVMAAQPGLQPTQRRRQTLHSIIRQWQLPEHHVERLFASWFNARQQVIYYDDVEVVLDHLAQRYSLIAVTNGNACRRRTGADRWFKHWISADDVGVAKPAPALFQAALQIMRCHPSHVLHVGDHPYQDMMGAERMGMQRAWVNRSDTTWSQACRQWPRECLVDLSAPPVYPTVEVSNLTALLTWLT